MRKYILSLAVVLSVFLLVGCGKGNKVVCTYTEEAEGQKMSMEIAIEYDKDNKITDVETTYDFGSEENAKQFCDAYKESDEMKDKVTCSGTKVTIKGIDGYSDEEEDSKQVIGSNKDDAVKDLTAEGFTCK